MNIIENQIALNLNLNKKTENKEQNFAKEKRNEVLRPFELNEENEKKGKEQAEKDKKVEEQKEKKEDSKISSKRRREEIKKREDYNALCKIGKKIVKSFLSYEQELPPIDFMKRHKIEHNLRTRMVDWMIEVFDCFETDNSTYFTAVHLLDTYIWKYQGVLNEDDIYLLGVACVFMSSKMYEEYPICVKSLSLTACHGDLTPQQILSKEREVYKVIGFDIYSLESYDILDFLLYDFYCSNKKKIKILNAKHVVEMFESATIFLSKMSKYFIYFSSVKPEYIAMACCMVGYDMLKEKCKIFKDKLRKIFKNWIRLVFESIARNDEKKKITNEVYLYLKKAFKRYTHLECQNLSQSQKLFFE